MEPNKPLDPKGADKTKEGSASAEISQILLEQDPLVQTVHKIVIDGIEQRASDILIEPLDTEVQIRYRIDGVLYSSLLLPKTYQEGVISRIKVLSGLDISEHRLPQDGRFKIKAKESEVDLRVSVIPSSLGEKIALRILDKSRVTLDINKLGFDARTLELFKRNSLKPFGMILVCGPTGSGKTTTLYSILKYLDSVEKNIVTVEDPVEYQLHGINQVAVYEEIGLTFASTLRSILRQDPNVILVGEIRDFETADTAVKAALTGHILLSTLHTISASGALVRLVNMGVEPFLIASSCLFIVSQVLVRLLCPECKEAGRFSDSVLEEFKAYNIALDKDAVLYNKKGCKACNNTGFKGRMAVGESIEISPAIKELITGNASEQDIRQA
ncbi:MAG: type II/IV secretion system protein, partial [Candidatus Omnitrophica bacterium]|nr:type II/IV secretion system protein [Candidatus Omnitrophota bacterium]